MDQLQNYQYTMDSCNHCGQCKWILPSMMHGWDYSEICPIHAYYGFDAYSGQGFLNIAKEILHGTLSYGDGLEEMISTCTLCGACDVNCKSVRDMEVLDTILALREDCAANGHLPEEQLKTAERIQTTQNIYGKDPADRFNWLPEGFRDQPEADTALFIGCAASYEHQEIALAAVNILEKLEIPFRLLYEDEWCCGIRLWQCGLTEAFEEQVRHHIDALQKRGIKRIITACAECFGTFRGGYPRVADFPFEVKHIAEIAAEKLLADPIPLSAAAVSGKVTWHDPCLLGRRSEWYVPWHGERKAFGLHVPPKVWRRGEFGIYDAPRTLIRSIPGLELIEMPRHAEEAWCCGGGGGSPSVHPELAKWTASERKREAADTGAEMILSACPFCMDALTDPSPDGMRCMDLTVLLSQALDGKGEAK